MDLATLASASGISGGVLAAIGLLCYWAKSHRSRCMLDNEGLSLSTRVIEPVASAPTRMPPSIVGRKEPPAPI